MRRRKRLSRSTSPTSRPAGAIGLLAITRAPTSTWQQVTFGINPRVGVSRLAVVVAMVDRWPDTALEQERRLNKFKIYAAREFARVNRLNRIVIDSDRPRLGVITTGKAYLDVLQALEDLGIDRDKAGRIGLRSRPTRAPVPRVRRRGSASGRAPIRLRSIAARR